VEACFDAAQVVGICEVGREGFDRHAGLAGQAGGEVGKLVGPARDG